MSLCRFASFSASAARTCQIQTQASTSIFPSLTPIATTHSSSPKMLFYTITRYFSFSQNSFQNRSSQGPGMTPPSFSRNSANTSKNSNSNSNNNSHNDKLDPDKIKGPGGLTMTQISKLVQQSRARDLEHQKSKEGKRKGSSQ